MNGPSILCALCCLLLTLQPHERDAQPGRASPDTDWLAVSGEETVRRDRASVGSVIEARREVTNRSDRAVRIRLLRSSCPCVTIEIEPAEVGPGESATVTARTHVAAVAEPQAHWVIVEVARFDEHGLVAESRQFRLNLEYTADLLLLVEPDRAWFVGTIGVPELRTFYLRSNGLDAVGFRNLRVEGEGFALDRVRRFRSMPEHRAPEDVLAVTVSYVGRSSEVVAGAVRFETDLPGMEEGRLRLEARARPRWRARPSGFALIYDVPAEHELVVEVLPQHGQPCPAHRAVVLLDTGSAFAEAARIHVQPADDRGTVRVTMGLSSRLLPDHGTANVRLLDSEGNEVLTLPVAWVRRAVAD